MCTASSNPLVAAIFGPVPDATTSSTSNSSSAGSASGDGAANPNSGSGGDSGAKRAGGKRRRKTRRGSMLRAHTVGSQFKSQLHLLMTAVRGTTPHYVRCLKPNTKARPGLFDRVGVVGQLRCGGVLEAVRVARLGYPVRLPHANFLSRCVVCLCYVACV